MDYSRLADLSEHGGKLFLLGQHPCGTLLGALDAASGAPQWTVSSTMDDPGALTSDASGIYLGGAKEQSYHVERRQLDGTLIWAQTALRDRRPAKLMALVRGDGHYLYAAGYQQSSKGRDWYFDGRSIYDGLRYTHGPGDPPE